MSEYFMLVSKSMWQHDPEFVKDIFRASMSRHGLVPTSIEARDMHDLFTKSDTGIIALVATVQAPEEDNDQRSEEEGIQL